MYKKIKLNTELRGNLINSIIRIEVFEHKDINHEYIPTDMYWRRRLKDSKVDGCIEFIEEDIKPLIKILNDTRDKEPIIETLKIID